MAGEGPGAPAPTLTPAGRAAETAAVGRLLGEARLVTVTGLPGVGKTAVSLAAAGAAGPGFADGTLLVRLDTLRDEMLLAHTIGAALELGDEFGRSRLEVLTGQLRDRHLLLVLDTCEHLLGACAATASALLTSCPRVRILATSREPLRVPGEATLAVRPLRLFAAAALFTERAAEAGVRIGLEHRAAVASICVQLDKLPLAIELAAGALARPAGAAAGAEAAGATAAGGAEAVTRSLAGMAAALETGYDFLAEPAGPVARHRSLRAAAGWSHQLCTPSERLLWARLSVFTGPFTPHDAQDVCTTSRLPDEAVAAGLALLTERSVLLAEADGRFLLPATLRGYGRQMLGRLGEEEEFLGRHRYWAKICEMPTK